MDYPDNVYVHGNGFIQVSLGGAPETRLHIWPRSLVGQCQKTNTQWHNHRFGFMSTVVSGILANTWALFEEVPASDPTGDWDRWEATGERGPLGNRPLMRQPGFFSKRLDCTDTINVSSSYVMWPVKYHRSEPVTEFAVTLMTKTEEYPADVFQASIMCAGGTEPDNTWDRRAIPFDRLNQQYIVPALAGTPFAHADIFR